VPTLRYVSREVYLQRNVLQPSSANGRKTGHCLLRAAAAGDSDSPLAFNCNDSIPHQGDSHGRHRDQRHPALCRRPSTGPTPNL